MKVWFFLKQNYHIGLLTFGSLLVVGMSYFVAYIACQRSIVYHYNNITGEEESRILESLGIPRSAAFDIEANGRLRDYNSLFGFSPLNENRKEYIRAYWLPCSDEKLEVKSRPTVLYLIGQKGNISFCLPNALRWGPELNVNILMVSYRGFGFSKSEGYPTQASIVADSQVR